MIVRKAIEEYKIPREKLVILTKCFATVHDDPYAGIVPPDCQDTKEYVNKHGNLILELLSQSGLSRKHIFEAVEASLKRLGMDYIDVLQIHRYDYDTPREETMKALHGIIPRGMILTTRLSGDGQGPLHWCIFNVCVSIPWTSACCREAWMDKVH